MSSLCCGIFLFISTSSFLRRRVLRVKRENTYRVHSRQYGVSIWRAYLQHISYARCPMSSLTSGKTFMSLMTTSLSYFWIVVPHWRQDGRQDAWGPGGLIPNSFSIFLAANWSPSIYSQLRSSSCFWNPSLQSHLTHHQIFTLAQHWSAQIGPSTNFSLAYKTLQSQKSSYLYNLLNLQANTSNRSSTVITLQRPPVNSRLKITDWSFTHHTPALWNSLPKDLRYPLSQTSSTNLSLSTNYHLLALSTSQFHSKLKTHLSPNHSRLSLLAPLL